MKNFIVNTVITATIILSATFNPVVVSAEEQVCTQSYGQPVVCGVKTPPTVHTPVDAGLADDPRTLGVSLVAFSGILLYFTRKGRASYISG